MGNGPSRPHAPRTRREDQPSGATPNFQQYPAPTGQQQQQANHYYQQGGYTNGQYYGAYGAHPPPNFGQNYPTPQQGQYPPPPAQLTAPAAYPQAAARLAPQTQEYQTTATIRNQVNLKKHTLAVAPLASDPSLLSITFSLDASASCRVSTFVCGHEDTKTCKVTARTPPAPAVMYDKGLDLKFPPPADAAAAAAHAINIANHAAKSLMEATAGSEDFPLIIRLEALTDEGRADGRSLVGLAVGGETPRWVQSQTTYARLVKEEDGHWGIRVIKQKIWVKGTSYELQEIYGMEQNRVHNVVTGFEDVEGNECVICMSAARDTTALPCRHMCMCHTCASALKTQTNKCPICRNEIESLLHIKINKGMPARPSGVAPNVQV